MIHDRTSAARRSQHADLYEPIFNAHGLAYSRNESMFISFEAPPPYYGSMTTLDPDEVDQRIAAIESLKSKRQDGFALKHGFCRLDLGSQGFRVFAILPEALAAVSRPASAALR